MHHECIILADEPGALVELCGISLLERLLRTLQRCAVRRALILSATPDVLAQRLANPSPHRAKVALKIHRRANGPVSGKQISAAWPNDAQQILVIPGDSVFDPRLLKLLDEQNPTVALVDSAPPENLLPLLASAAQTNRGRICGAMLLSRDWVQGHAGLLEPVMREEIEAGLVETLDVTSVSQYLASLRRELRPYWFPAPASEDRKIAEHLLLDATQKGTLDFPALVHAPIEKFLVSYLCKTSITPNQLTVLTNLVAWGVTFLFATGHLAWGIILALTVGILDGLDGKQARVKVETSKAGKLEHWFDALFENSWWIALAYHLQTTGQLPGAFRYLFVLICAEAAGGLAGWSVILFFDRLIDELGGFGRFVRFIGARRNTLIWIFVFSLLLGVPVLGFKLMVWWGVITAAVQVPYAAFALWLRWQKRTPA